MVVQPQYALVVWVSAAERGCPKMRVVQRLQLHELFKYPTRQQIRQYEQDRGLVAADSVFVEGDVLNFLRGVYKR